MHELSLAQSMLEQLADAVKAEGETYSRIERIDLEIGSMSGVDRESFEFVFPFAAEGTLAEGAELTFVEVQVLVKCAVCQKTTPPEYPFIACVNCGSVDTEILQGRDFKITKMEVS